MSSGSATARAIAFLYILGLLAAGIAVLVQAPQFDTLAIALLAFFIPAFIYALGAFRFFPELLGGPARSQTPGQRWAGLLRASLVLYVPATVVFMVAVLHAAHPDWAALALGAVLSAGTVLVSLLSCGLLKACSCGGEEATGWMRRLACVPRLFKPRVSLLTGAALVLVTLYLGTTLTGCGDPRSGYNVLIGRDRWITAEHLPYTHHVARSALTYVGRGSYSLAVALAAATMLVLLASWRRTSALHGRLARFFTGVAALVALFAAPDLFFAWWPAAADTSRGILYSSLALSVLYWLAPLALLLTRANRPDWQRIRVALILLYLPIVLSDWVFTTYIVIFGAYGYAAYLAGLALLWWGYVQATAAQPQDFPEERQRAAVGG